MKAYYYLSALDRDLKIKRTGELMILAVSM